MLGFDWRDAGQVWKKQIHWCAPWVVGGREIRARRESKQSEGCFKNCYSVYDESDTFDK